MLVFQPRNNNNKYTKFIHLTLQFLKTTKKQNKKQDFRKANFILIYYDICERNITTEN